MSYNILKLRISRPTNDYYRILNEHSTDILKEIASRGQIEVSKELNLSQTKLSHIKQVWTNQLYIPLHVTLSLVNEEHIWIHKDTIGTIDTEDTTSLSTWYIHRDLAHYIHDNVPTHLKGEELINYIEYLISKGI